MAVPVPGGMKRARKQAEAGPGLLLIVHTAEYEPEGSFKAPGDAEPGITVGNTGFSTHGLILAPAPQSTLSPHQHTEALPLQRALEMKLLSWVLPKGSPSVFHILEMSSDLCLPASVKWFPLQQWCLECRVRKVVVP